MADALLQLVSVAAMAVVRLKYKTHAFSEDLEQTIEQVCCGSNI